MSNTENNPAGSGQSDLPTWDEKYQFFRMQAWFRILAVLVVGLWVGLIAWVLLYAPITDATAKALDFGATFGEAVGAPPSDG